MSLAYDMSTTSKVVLGISVLLSGGIVVGVHMQQRRVREVSAAPVREAAEAAVASRPHPRGAKASGASSPPLPSRSLSGCGFLASPAFAS